eukprot:m.131924 g.131924  ORF g.131924 m.131924 type:complete len:101 (+) comp38055_c0_seq1:120-422(+)
MMECPACTKQFLVVQQLLERGCNLFNPDSKVESPFHPACSQGSVPLIQAILQHCKVSIQIVLDYKDPSGQTPLHKAAIFDHTVVAEFLVKKVYISGGKYQ